MELAKAYAIAEQIAALLRPQCRQIEIAGSVRRQKAEPKDIEICYVPKMLETHDLFGHVTGEFALPDGELARIVDDGVLAWDNEVKRAGPRYKRLLHVTSGMVVELFSATADNWGLILALRTGPGDFSKLMVTQARYGGAMPPGMKMQDGRLWYYGEPRNTPTEEVFFANLRLPCWSPGERTVERLREYLQQHVKSRQ